MSAGTHVEYLTTGDGVRIAVHRHGTGAQRALLVPGTFSNHTFWLGTRGTGFARYLAAQGIETWSLDPRGHGASDRERRGQRWDFDDWARQDVSAAVRAAAGPPLVIVGHSAGGAAVLAALAADPALRPLVRAVVILATPLPWLQRWRGMAGRVVFLLARVLPRFPARLLRLGPEDELHGVMVQWVRWQLRRAWVGDDGTDYGDALAALGLPVLFVAGAGDRLYAPPAACRSLFELVGSADKTFLQCGRGSGFSRDFGHVDLVVSREAQAELWPLLCRWIRRFA